MSNNEALLNRQSGQGILLYVSQWSHPLVVVAVLPLLLLPLLLLPLLLRMLRVVLMTI